MKNPRRLSKQISIHMNTMKQLYEKLETLQKEVAVTRSERHRMYTIISATWLYFQKQVPIHLCFKSLINPAHWRPEIRKEILQHCSSCTRTDVALNNLVVRSRTRAVNSRQSCQAAPAAAARSLKAPGRKTTPASSEGKPKASAKSKTKKPRKSVAKANKGSWDRIGL